MKKFVPFLCFALFFAPINAAEQPPVKTKQLALMDTSYFTSKHLEQLKAQGTSVHAPCLLLLDPNYNENPKSENKAVTSMLLAGIRIELPLIITSKSIIHNLPHFQEKMEIIMGKQTGLSGTDLLRELEQFTVSLSSKNWQLFFVPESELAVLIPHRFTQLYANKGLNLNNLEEQTELLDDTDALQQETQYQTESTPYEVAQILKEVFEKYPANALTDPSMPIWDVFIHGHGNPNKRIAGIPSTNMQDLLTFFNTHIATGSALIQSCYAAGQNSTLLQIKQQFSSGKGTRFELNQLKYPLFVLGYPDAITISLFAKEFNRRFLEKFFIYAAQLKQQKSLGELLNAMDTLNQELDIQRTTNIPQVWLPGGIGFQSYTTDKMIFALGPVRATAHELEEKPIVLPSDTRAVLLYSKGLKVPIIVNQPIKPLEKEPTPMQEEWKLSGAKLEWYYPRFLSMVPGDSTHAFSSIVLPKQPPKLFLGVLAFIAQSLITFHVSQKTFLVDTLEGLNDFSFLIVVGMGLEPKTKKDFEQLPPLTHSYKKSARATLEQLIVQTKEIDLDIKALKVSFILDGQGWKFDSTKSKKYWDFKEIDPNEHRAAYEKEKAKIGLQPSLYERIVQIAQDKQEMWSKLLLPIYPAVFTNTMTNLLKKSYFLDNPNSALTQYVWYLYSNAPLPEKIESYPRAEKIVVDGLSSWVHSLNKTYKYDAQEVTSILEQQNKLIQQFSKDAQSQADTWNTKKRALENLLLRKTKKGLRNKLSSVNQTFIDLKSKANLSAFLTNNVKPLQSLYDQEFTQPDKLIFARNYLPRIMPFLPARLSLSKQPKLTTFEIEAEQSGNAITLIQPSQPDDVVLLISSLVNSVAPFFTKRRDLQEHTFLIKNITGYNDLSVVIEMVNLLHKQNISLPWLEQFINKPITLESVIITVKEIGTDTYRPQITIEGILDGHGVRITSSYITGKEKSQTPSWTIEEIKPEKVKENFNQQLIELKTPEPPQKSIPAVLKQQQEGKVPEVVKKSEKEVQIQK